MTTATANSESEFEVVNVLREGVGLSMGRSCMWYFVSLEMTEWIFLDNIFDLSNSSFPC